MVRIAITFNYTFAWILISLMAVALMVFGAVNFL